MIIGSSEMSLFFQNRSPGEAGLIDFQNQTAEERIVLIYGKTIAGVVIAFVDCIRVWKGSILAI